MRALWCGVLALGVIVCGAMQPVAADIQELFVPGEAGAARPTEPTVQRARPVGVRMDLLAAAVAGDGVVFNLFDDARIEARFDALEFRDGLSFTWTGALPRDAAGGDGWFVLSVEQDAMVLNLWTADGRAFEVRPAPDGVPWARELNSAKFPRCATGREQVWRPGEDDDDGGFALRGGCPDSGEWIDVLIVYTPAARSGAGGTNAIIAMCNSCISSANNAYQQSGIATRLRLAHRAEVDYAEGSGFSQDLSRLRSTSDGHMDEVHALRNQYNADMVALLNANSGACGIAYLMTNLSPSFATSAFSVTHYSCAVGNLTFAHELGHNMGCAHDRDNAGSALYSYSYGHRWVGTNGTTYRSVMAYSPGSRVARFSNPDVLHQGTPTGIPPGQSNSAHNAQSINLAAYTIANFRNSGEVQGPSISMQPQPQSVQQGQTAVFAVAATGAETYQWTRNGAMVVNGGRISGATSPVLIITGVQTSDAGTYRVTVANACSGTQSNAADLAVSVPCAADFDGNGEVEVSDIFAFLAAWFNSEPAAYFFGGSLGVSAILVFLDTWFAGCP
ncbi:MAG: immunoglobulin domain-containing protein [Phycisphaeraceae bacterium]|nr:immunoglobulin domain-containing protein [Phycisphaeraceae bacterium]